MCGLSGFIADIVKPMGAETLALSWNFSLGLAWRISGTLATIFLVAKGTNFEFFGPVKSCSNLINSEYWVFVDFYTDWATSGVSGDISSSLLTGIETFFFAFNLSFRLELFIYGMTLSFWFTICVYYGLDINSSLVSRQSVSTVLIRSSFKSEEPLIPLTLVLLYGFLNNAFP
jgi:hypothetical protein